MPRLSKVGAAALAAFGWTSGSAVSASYLVVAGGGGGGAGTATVVEGGGGGAGGYRTGTASLNPTLSYTVTVGAGGTSNTNGSDSIFSVTTSTGGGAGGRNGTNSGSTGGSGGGAVGLSVSGASGNTPSTSPSQGNNGGTGVGPPYYASAGGGGAGAVGGTAVTAPGAGGAGTANSITGSSVTYAGGGGGTKGGATSGAGGAGGGGAGAISGNGNPGTANLGGGGGAGSSVGSGAGGNGGSGVVIISYPGAQQFGGGVVTTDGTNTIHTFTTSGTLSPITPLTAQYLIVAGGGGGGSAWTGGGGGAGGMLTGTGVTIDTNSNYVVTVGAGGSAATSGSNSSWSMVSTAAVGGGYGITDNSSSPGGNGGSGGGSGYNVTSGGGTGTSGQGNNGGGGSGWDGGAGTVAGGGGGGKSAVGANAAFSSGGAGGAGAASSISGSSVTYAGGGGGGSGAGSAGAGGAGGGGAGALGSNASGTAGTANTGGGGGGAAKTSGTGGTGGSGIVIISYPGATQQMAGGTVTISGGNVIHTFTSSGYLTPIKFVGRSLRFRASNSAYLSRTPTVAGNRKTWTFSAWVKRGALISGSAMSLLNAGRPNSPWTLIAITTELSYGPADTITVSTVAGVSPGIYMAASYRDPSAWYHIVVAMDTTQATATDRIKVYINGVRQAATTSPAPNLPAQNYDTYVNSTTSHSIGALSNGGGGEYFDGYMAEVNLIDGQALTPSSFGTFNSFGVWQPITYGGSYGTNGFYLTFGNNTSTTTLGYDTSPQGNNWTTNNISLTAGVTYDSMTDVPTLTSATVANYAVLNPLIRQYSAVDFASDGNLKYTVGSNGGATDTIIATMAMVSGKWYAEVYINAAVSSQWVGVSSNIIVEGLGTAGGGVRNPGYAYKVNTGNKCNNDNTGTAYAASSTTGDTIGIAMDADAGSITFYKNGTSLGVAFTGMTNSGNGWAFGCDSDPNGSFFWNFGQQGFKYTPPSGFVALNTFNLSTPTIPNGATQMAATTYTGNGSTQSIVNTVNGTFFQPDWVWIKKRSAAAGSGLFDVIRGAGVVLTSNTTDAERNNGTGSGGDLIAFNSNGFNLGNNTTGSAADTNLSGGTYVGWQWKANGTGVTNTSGTITSTVSANTTAGFSIVTYTGTGATATVGHGLGVAPSMVITKKRSTAGDEWVIWHTSLTSGTFILLFTTAAQFSSSQYTAVPSSTVLNLNTATAVNNSGSTYVSYVFAAIAGYSAFGSYTGNGSTDGPFVFLGFRPRWVLIKNTGQANDWFVMDSSMNTYNVVGEYLFPNTSAASSTNSWIDFLSNGFKIRSTATGNNNNGIVQIYAAFAENPFKYSSAR